MIEVISTVLGCFIGIFYTILLVTQWSNTQFRWLAFSGVSLCLVILSKTNTIDYRIVEVVSLLFWISFYLFTYTRNYRGFNKRLLFLLFIPFVWLSSYILLPDISELGLFDWIYLFITFLFGGLSYTEIHNMLLVNKTKKYYPKNYLLLLQNGLVVLLLIRLILPVILNSGFEIHQYFHLTLGLYFMLLTYHFIQIPGAKPESNQSFNLIQEQVNYQEQIKRKLKTVMERDRAYLNPELTLNDVAELTGMRLVEISNFINNKLGRNFNDFVNEYRVKAFKDLVSSKDRDVKATIIELAYDSGFNSKASFNRIFKEQTGFTPTEFKKSISR